jgi:hypothetical protein
MISIEKQNNITAALALNSIATDAVKHAVDEAVE